MIDILYNFDIITISLYKIHIILFNISNLYSKQLGDNFQNLTFNRILSKKKICILDCETELENIKNFYNKVSQFKIVYKMIPIKIYKIDTNKCRILYYKESGKTLIKEDRIINFEYLINQNTCNWYINDMSANIKKYN